MTKEAFAPELEAEYRLAPSESAEPDLSGAPSLLAPPRVDDAPTFESFIDAPPLPQQKFASTPATNNIQQLAVQRTARRRQVLMVAVFGSSGVLLAGMLFAAFLYWYTGKSNPAIAKNPPNQNTPEQKHVGPKREPEQDLVSDPLVEPEADPSLELPLSPIDNDSNANKPKVIEAPAVSAEEKNTISSAIANSLANPALTKPNLVEPNSIEPSAAEQPTAPSLETVVDKSATELPEQLKKFQGILNTAIEPQFVEDQAMEKAPPTAKELGLSTGPEAKALPATDVDKQLQLTLTGLIIPAGSISSAVSQWVQVSGVPTVVDLDSFVASGVDPYKPIDKLFSSDARTLAQVGASIAKEIGVDLNTIENRFLAFQASEAAIREHLPTVIKVSDLLTDEDQQQWFVKTLEQIWPEYEGKWIVREGELTVDPIAVDALAWFWAVRLLESWRHAAKMDTQLDKTKLDQSKFVTKFVDPEQIAALSKPLSIKGLVNRAPVAQLISEICAATQMHAWVDWASVGQKGLGPNTIDFVVTRDRTLRQCMRDFAEKYSLVVACEDEKSLWITTAEVYRAQPRLYVLPSQGKSAEQWMEELQPLTPATAAAAQPVRAFLTPDSRFVIVRCCRPRLRN
jgi:hypothetical protein